MFFFYRGRVALYALLKALNIERGDEVLLQAFTCVAVPEGVMAAGAKPVWIDIKTQDFNMDPIDLRNKITSRSKAIIVQHTYGIPADMDDIMNISITHKVPVIEDCCHTIASTYRGCIVGSFGAGSFYSFEWGKPLVAGLGGAAQVNELSLVKKLRDEYRNYMVPSISARFKLCLQYIGFKALYRPSLYWHARMLFHKLDKLGLIEGNYNSVKKACIDKEYSYRMIPELKIIASNQFRKLNEITEHSQSVVNEYNRRINNKRIIHPNVGKEKKAIFNRYPLRVNNKAALLRVAKMNNIEIADWYFSPVHPLQSNDLRLVYYENGMCPNAETTCKEVVTLPTHKGVTEHYIERVANLMSIRDSI
jgi:dTDP-4-amino-4,6-dideoxygalactose transaminase